MTTPESTIADLLRAGLGTREVRAQTRADYGRIARIRRRYGIPVPRQQPPTRSIADALALYAEPHGDGHLRWTGPTRGRTPLLLAEGERANARAVTFSRHWGRQPVGYIRTTCTAPGCLAGAHLADSLARTAARHPDPTEAITHLIQGGAGDQEIVTRLGASTISRLRRTGRAS
ncbi:hypothetical protein [Streptomyces sp. NPDC050535]|uniref:hypothetical protein n=1 Tax=Streptomyces sp. NPDC050535 TaxID=3365626 RepID=UPI0037A39A6F